MSGESGKLKKDELREDEFVDWVMQAVDYVRDRYQLFLGGLVALAVLFLAIDYIIDSQEDARLEAASLLGQAQIAEEEGSPEESQRLAAQLVDEYEGTPAAAQGTLMLANRQFAQANYGEAQRLYEKYLADYGQNELLVYAAWSGLAACLEAQGQGQAAARKFQEFAAAHPKTLQAALALWEAARCYAQLGDTSTRKEILEQLVRDYHQLPLATQAKETLSML